MIEEHIKLKIFENKYYVYELVDPNTDKVFYVGKGQKYRCFVHEYQTKNGKIPHNNNHLYNKINQILNCDKNIKYNIIFSSNNENECYDLEEKIILQYGIGNLCNIELSNKGVKHTKETREKISKAHTGKKLSNETKEKIRNINIGNKHTDEAKKKVSDSLKEQYANGSRNQHIFIHDDKWYESIKIHILGKKHTPESIQKMRDVQKGKIISQDQRDKISKILTRERIKTTINCKRCNKEFEVTLIKDTKNKSVKKYCCKKCSYSKK